MRGGNVVLSPSAGFRDSKVSLNPGSQGSRWGCSSCDSSRDAVLEGGHGIECGSLQRVCSISLGDLVVMLWSSLRSDPIGRDNLLLPSTITYHVLRLSSILTEAHFELEKKVGGR